MEEQNLTIHTPQSGKLKLSHFKLHKNLSNVTNIESVDSPAKPRKPLWMRIAGGESHSHIKSYKKLRGSILGITDKDNQLEDKFKTAIDRLVNMNKQKVIDMNEYAKKKRNMLLLHLKIDDTNNKIEDMQRKVKAKKEKLNNIDTVIQKDLDVFNEFVRDSKRQTKDLLKQTQDEVKAKDDALNAYSNLHEKKISLALTNMKKLDQIKQLLVYKDFVDTHVLMNKSHASLRDSHVEQLDMSQISPKDMFSEEDFLRCYDSNFDANFYREILHAKPIENLDDNLVHNVDYFIKQVQKENLRIIGNNQARLSAIAVEEARFEQTQKALELKITELKKKEMSLQAGLRKLNTGDSVMQKEELERRTKDEKITDMFVKKVEQIAIPMGSEHSNSYVPHLAHIEKRVLTDLEAISEYSDDQLRKFEKILLEESKVKYLKELGEEEQRLNESRRKKLLSKDFVQRNERKHNFRNFVKEDESCKTISNRDPDEEENEKYFTYN